ncbi:MAG: hypothetical protein D6683_03940 [Actinomyces sp.]|nr:MAG: hypothetical protein D6683_03940 [Actinomyces sp.]
MNEPTVLATLRVRPGFDMFVRDIGVELGVSLVDEWAEVVVRLTESQLAEMLARTGGVVRSHRVLGPAARSTDPDTSHEAVPSTAQRESMQRAIVRTLAAAARPLTCGEIGERLADPPIPASSVARRISELADLGRVVDAGVGINPQSGRRARRWKLA